MAVPALAWAATKRYNESDALGVAGKPDWFRALKSGAVETESKQLARTPTNLDVEFVDFNGASHAVKFFVDGPNPLLSLAPAINAEIIVGLRKTVTGKVEFSIEGKHDGFPNYTLSINGTAVYFWDCVAKNEDPSALGPPMDQVVSLGWKSL